MRASVLITAGMLAGLCIACADSGRDGDAGEADDARTVNLQPRENTATPVLSDVEAHEIPDEAPPAASARPRPAHVEPLADLAVFVVAGEAAVAVPAGLALPGAAVDATVQPGAAEPRVEGGGKAGLGEPPSEGPLTGSDWPAAEPVFPEAGPRNPAVAPGHPDMPPGIGTARPGIIIRGGVMDDDDCKIHRPATPPMRPAAGALVNERGPRLGLPRTGGGIRW
ncbi:MAG: hypothetical protein WEF86_04710 [Gemmatimonadota bacterium]